MNRYVPIGVIVILAAVVGWSFLNKQAQDSPKGISVPVTQFVPESSVRDITYLHANPGEYPTNTITEPLFGEGVIVDPQSSERLPANIQNFGVQGHPYVEDGKWGVVRMLYVNQDQYKLITGSSEVPQGVLFMVCGNVSKSAGEHVLIGKSIYDQCNPGDMGVITSDGKDIAPVPMWAAG